MEYVSPIIIQINVISSPKLPRRPISNFYFCRKSICTEYRGSQKFFKILFYWFLNSRFKLVWISREDIFVAAEWNANVNLDHVVKRREADMRVQK